MSNSIENVATYETIHDGSIVSIQLPKKVTLKQVKDDDGNVASEYLHWGVNLPGGVVNCHVIASDLSLANTTIRARVEVVIKTTEGGRQFILVNYHPVDRSEKPTRKLVIMPNTFEQLEHWLVFPAPNLRGFVALIGPDEKLVPPPVKARDGAVVGKDRRISRKESGRVEPIEGNRPFAELLNQLVK